MNKPYFVISSLSIGMGMAEIFTTSILDGTITILLAIIVMKVSFKRNEKY